MDPPLPDPGGLHIKDRMPLFGNVASDTSCDSHPPALSVVAVLMTSVAWRKLGEVSGNWGDPPENTKHFTPGPAGLVPRLHTVSLRYPGRETHVVGAVRSTPV